MPPAAQLFVVLLVVALFWFVLLRPARNQQRRVQDLQRELHVGDDVVLSAGIFGVIRSLDDGRVTLEVSPGTVITVARQAVVRRVEPEPVPDPQPHVPDQQDQPDQPEQPLPDPGPAPERPDDEAQERD